MPRFVILEHDYQGVHWDFMLESAGVLRTWRLLDVPCGDRPVFATPLPDHRTIYLEYEGPVSGGRGAVKRWDWGEFDWAGDRPGSVEVTIRGQRLCGCVYLFKGASDEWTFRLTPLASSP